MVYAERMMAKCQSVYATTKDPTQYNGLRT